MAYYDGLSHLIVSVGLVTPKPGVFITDVKYLLVITTTIEIVILGVTFDETVKPISTASSISHEMQLMNKPIFILNTDNVAITTIAGTADHRIFLGGRDGTLFEIGYQAESNWFGKRCKKINLHGVMSAMVPGFLKMFSEVDAIAKIVVDDTRHLLYTLTEKGAIEAWDIGKEASDAKRVARLSQNEIVQRASSILK